jgi:hypothetical protein
MSTTLRTPITEGKYVTFKESRNEVSDGCSLCEKKSTVDFKYWKIVENLFPYDRIAKKHRMLIPARHVEGGQLNEMEKIELEQIKKYAGENRYDYILETTSQKSSIPEHYHLHLIELKEDLDSIEQI